MSIVDSVTQNVCARLGQRSIGNPDVPMRQEHRQLIASLLKSVAWYLNLAESDHSRVNIIPSQSAARTQHEHTALYALGRTSCLTQTLPFLGLLHAVLLEPDGVDVDEASCVADHQSAKPSQIAV